jgi:hypothetical protein
MSVLDRPPDPQFYEHTCICGHKLDPWVGEGVTVQCKHCRVRWTAVTRPRGDEHEPNA